MDMKQLLDDAPPDRLEELERLCGLTRNPQRVLWDPYIANLISVPYCIFWDAMHCVFGSGGNAQYLVNGFALECLAHGIAMADLDHFTTTIKGHTLNKVF